MRNKNIIFLGFGNEYYYLKFILKKFKKSNLQNFQ